MKKKLAAMFLAALMLSIVLAGCGGKGGDSTPSREDCILTRQVLEAGDLVGIRLLDHIVIGDNNFCSFKKEGML